MNFGFKIGNFVLSMIDNSEDFIGLSFHIGYDRQTKGFVITFQIVSMLVVICIGGEEV